MRSVVAELLTALALALLALIAGWFIDRERGAWILVLAVAVFFFLRQMWLVLRLIQDRKSVV